MDINAAYSLAKKLMLEHGLITWRFQFDNARRRFGSCQYRINLITLSKHLTELNDVEQVKDTILHEIAHALTPGHGHDYVWQRKAIEIGCNGKRCYNSKEVETPESKFIATCIGCGKIFKKHRTPTHESSCKMCSGGRYNPQFKLNFVLNPNY